jgi:hypothetical protein
MSVPDWVKHDPYVLHVPNTTLFTPQPFLRIIKDVPHLVDCKDQNYPLSQCERLSLKHLTRGVALLVTEDESLTLYPHSGIWFVVAGSKGRCGVAPLKGVPESERVALELARFFDGAVWTEREEGDGQS